MFSGHFYAVHSFLSSFATISLKKRDLVALFQLSSCFYLTVSVLSHIPDVPWVGLQCVIVVFLGHSNLRFYLK